MPLKREIGVEIADAAYACRFRGNANSTYCCARNLNANNVASNTNANNGGSAKV